MCHYSLVLNWSKMIIPLLIDIPGLEACHVRQQILLQNGRISVGKQGLGRSSGSRRIFNEFYQKWSQFNGDTWGQRRSLPFWLMEDPGGTGSAFLCIRYCIYQCVYLCYPCDQTPRAVFVGCQFSLLVGMRFLLYASEPKMSPETFYYLKSENIDMSYYGQVLIGMRDGISQDIFSKSELMERP